MHSIQTTDPPTGKSGNRKLLLIIIGVAIVIFIALFLIIAAAVGIYFYTAKPKSPPFERPMPTPARPAPARTDQKTQALIEVMKKWKTIGDFELQNAAPTYAANVFENSQGEAKGIYTSKGRTVNFVVAEYGTKTEAITNFGRLIGKERAAKTRITQNLKITGNTIHAEFEKGELNGALFCSWADGKATLCHQITANGSAALAEFRRSLSERKTVNQ